MALNKAALLLFSIVLVGRASAVPPQNDYHHYHRPRVHPPLQPPTPPSTRLPVEPPTKKPPAKPPTKPTHPPTFAKPPIPTPPVAVQGVVYCKSCNTTGISTLNGASPLPGARVALKCMNEYFHAKAMGVTDKNGYFFLFAPKGVTPALAKTCRVCLAPRPKKLPCNKPTALNGGLAGAALKPQEIFVRLPYSLYTVGPFAYEPYKKCT